MYDRKETTQQAAARLGLPELFTAAHGISWRQLYRANRAAVGADPDLIHAGLRLRVPARK